MKNYLLVLITFLLGTPWLFAAVEGETSALSGSSGGMIAIASGIAIGLAALGGAIGQGLVAFSAVDGVARNPSAQSKIQTPMIIALALIESLVIYAFVIAIILSGKIG